MELLNDKLKLSDVRMLVNCGYHLSKEERERIKTKTKRSKKKREIVGKGEND